MNNTEGIENLGKIKDLDPIVMTIIGFILGFGVGYFW